LLPLSIQCTGGAKAHGAVSASLLQAVSEVAALAGAEALKHFRSRLAVESKADGSPVTRADRDA
jgi:3'-phosphoadenosine 5'-phosphosulfate (PAPS) 3'-phosphatase